jgi:hypothetical protein
MQRIISRKNPDCALIPTDRGRLGKPGYVFPALRRIAADVLFKLDYYYSDGLPGRVAALDPHFRKYARRVGVVGLHKFLTYKKWFDSKLKQYAQDGLRQAQGQQRGIWNRKSLEALIQSHWQGHVSNLGAINAVLTISAIQRLLLDERNLARGDTPTHVANLHSDPLTADAVR